jgi:hypothetical protein
MARMNERRRAARRTVNFKVQHRDPKTKRAVFDFAKDLSTEGMFLRTRRHRPIGATLDLEFPIDDPTQPKRVKVKVEITRVTPEGVAAKFAQLDPDSALLLNLLLSR